SCAGNRRGTGSGRWGRCRCSTGAPSRRSSSATCKNDCCQNERGDEKPGGETIGGGTACHCTTPYHMQNIDFISFYPDLANQRIRFSFLPVPFRHSRRC